MRILWCTVDRSHRVAQQFDIFRNAVKQQVEVVELFKKPAGDHGENMWQLSRDLLNGNIKTNNIVLDYLKEDNNFDFIFCDAFFSYTEEDWQSISIPIGIFIEDVHHNVPREQLKRAKSKGIQNIFHRFNFQFHKLHPNARRDFKCFWLPHSVNTDMFRDLNLERRGVLHVGVFPQKYYPHRANVVYQLKPKPYFTRIRRPDEGGDRRLKWPIDEDYVKVLNKAKICITGGSIFNAPVQKYVEIPAVGTLLMSNWFADLGLLGYKDKHNMIAYNEENLIPLVEGLLKDEERLNHIAANGTDLILSNHTSDIRAKQFINNICQIVNKPLKYNIKPCSYQVNFNSNKIKLNIPTYQLPETIEPKFNPKPKQRLGNIKKIIKGNRITNTDWRSRIK